MSKNTQLEELIQAHRSAGYTDTEIEELLFGKSNGRQSESSIRDNASEAVDSADMQRSEAAKPAAEQRSQTSGTRYEKMMAENFSTPEATADFLANLGYCPYREDIYDECKYGWHTPEETCPECVLAWLLSAADSRK